MKTDDLIHALAADIGTRPPPPSRRLALYGVLGLLLSACLFALILRPRPDFGDVIETPRVAFKFLIALTLVAAAALVARRAMRPDAHPRLAMVLLPVLALLGVGVGMELLVSPAASWGRRMLGHYALPCVALIPLLSLPSLALLLAAFRSGAPAQPAMAGAIAGLLAAGLGAGIYAMHCPDDSPLFVAVWYGLAVSIVTAIGAALGSRLLRW